MLVRCGVRYGGQREELALNNIQQFFVRCQGEQEKYSFLSKIYGLLTIGQSIIFCNVRRCRPATHSLLRAHGAGTHSVPHTRPTSLHPKNRER